MIRGVSGIPSSPGSGVGPAVIISQRHISEEAKRRTGEATGDGEYRRFRAAVEVTGEYYRKTMALVAERIGEEEAEIFEGYLELLTGDDMDEGVREALDGRGNLSAEGAALSFCLQTAAEFEAMESEYFSQRAADIRDIGNRLAEAIHFGDILDVAALSEPSVIIARELSPAYTVNLDLASVAGIATEAGGPTSHAAILARSLSLPCVTGAGGILEAAKPGEICLVDGDAGTVEVGVSPEKAAQIAELTRARRREDEAKREWSRNTQAVTADGIGVQIKANVSSADDARRAVEAGAHGSGLVRTEFIYMSYDRFPSVDQQADYYRDICVALQPHPVTIRLLDCGADKPLPYADQKAEDNPFLGERGIRFLFSHRDILRDQLMAIGRLRAQGYNVRAMIPMVISVSEIREVRAMLNGFQPDLPLGIMVETPASVLRIEALAAESDFLSIGTNDLVQYLLAVDRGNPAVAGLYQELHPAVISALARISEAAAAAGIPLGVCGNMASRPETVLALLALGVRELSASSSAVPRIKELITSLDGAELERIAAELRSCGSPGDCGRYIDDRLRAIMGGDWK
jgi:phosphotransferase system enzyme I (PtsI)